MKYEDYLLKLKGFPDFKEILTIIKNKEIYPFLVGLKCSKKNDNDGLSTSPGVVIHYLHIFISEKVITLEEVNAAFHQITIQSLEDVWLLMTYIKANLLYIENRKKPLVKLDLTNAIKQINEVWNNYKDDYTVKILNGDIKKVTGKPLFGTR